MICSSQDFETVEVVERMLGLGDRFVYMQCRGCGCLQLSDRDIDFKRYYPPDYYSFAETSFFSRAQAAPFLARLKDALTAWAINLTSGTRALFLNSASTLAWLKSNAVLEIYLEYLKKPDAEILDVGCGNGRMIENLMHLRYRNVSGCDPFIEKDITWNGQVVVRKAYLTDLDSAYDCISFHHVLEHMPDQQQALRDAASKLRPDGIIIVRIPVADSFAHREYREKWVQLDAPRHFFLHSKTSFERLVRQAGLEIRSIKHDSTEFQFWGSELYRRDIALSELGKPGYALSDLFSEQALDEFSRHAEALNAVMDGDQIVAILGLPG